MKLSDTIRVMVMTAILIILAYFSVGYTYEIYCTGLEELVVDTSNINDVNIDGADFAVLFRLMGLGVNSLVSLFVYGIYALIILFVSLLLLVPFSLIGIRKSTVITESERKISKRIFIGMIVVSVIVGLVLTGGTVIIPLLIYTLIWVVVVGVTYIRPLYRKRG